MQKETVSDSVSDLAADILRGAEAIGRFIGCKDKRKAFYLLSRGLIPARKEGGECASSRTALRKHYQF